MLRRPKTLLAVLVGAAAVVVVVRGLLLSRYEPVSSDAYLWGAFHVHSTLSDGLAPLEDIAAEARKARVSFVLLSDHGPPHPEAARIDETLDGVRFIGGSEVGMPEGHLIVSDLDTVPKYHLPPFPPDAVDEVHAWGGFSVLTYPEDPTHRWSYWKDDFTPDGIEIVNVTSYFRASSIWQKLDWALFSLFNRFYYVSGLTSPAYALGRWDELLERGPVWAFYAANAHGGFPLTEERMIAIPSYATAFGFVGLGIDRRFSNDPAEAVRRGEFFAIVRAAGEPERFELVRKGDGVRVRLDADGLRPRIVLKRDGAVVAETDERELVHESAEPGVYRAEVYLEDHALLSDDVPWILSNPLFVDVERRAPVSIVPECDDVEALDLSELHVEKDDASTASLERGASGELMLDYHLSQSTEDKVDRWVALALRREMDLSDALGIVVSGTGPEPMRYWIEIRAGDEGHYATFKVSKGSPESEGSFVPWNRFYPTVGAPRPLPLADVDALFIAVNTSSSQTGFSSSLTLSALAVCR